MQKKCNYNWSRWNEYGITTDIFPNKQKNIFQFRMSDTGIVARAGCLFELKRLIYVNAASQWSYIKRNLFFYLSKQEFSYHWL